MRRRTLLAGTTAGLIGPIAGCSGYRDGPDEPTGEWTQLQANAAHTGAADENGPRGGGRIRWWSETTGRSTSPVIHDGTVYSGSGLRNQAVFAFDQATGERRWRAPIDEDIGRALAVSDGLVYVSARGVSALDVETGDEEWTDSTDTSWGLAYADETVYAASGGGGPLVALDAETGEQRWRREVHTITTPTVAEGRVFAAGNGTLLALDAETGDTEWTETIDPGGGPPTVADNTVLVGTRGGLFAHDTETGTRTWSLEGNFRGTDISSAHSTLYLTGRQEDGEEWISRALAVETATGDIQWSQAEEELGAGSTVVTNDTVYVTTQGRLYALDRETGEVDWWLRFQWPVSSPAVAGDTLYVNVGGRLLAVESGDGRAGVWRTDADPIPDRSATPPEPSYGDADFSFGMAGYDVRSDWDVTVDEDAPVDVSFSIEGDRVDGDEVATITLAVTNESDEELRFSTGAPEPFGVFSLHGAEGRIIPWTPAYEESGHVHTTPNRGVRAVHSIGLSTAIPPGETISETYTISEETHGIQPGTYEFSIEKFLSPGEMGEDRDSWAFEVAGSVELAARDTDAGSVIHDIVVADEVGLPDAFTGRFAVDVLDPVTDTHPGLIELTFENVTDERSLVASMRDWPFGAFVGHGPEGRRLVLLPAATYAPGFVQQTDSGWWEPTFLPHESTVLGRSTTAFDPGETTTRRFIVTTHPETDDPHDGDGYAFEQGFGDDDVDVTWGFVLSTLDSDR